MEMGMDDDGVSVKDFVWEGTESQKFKFEQALAWEMKFMEPAIDFEEFQFTIKVIDTAGAHRSGGFMIGICQPNHEKDCYFGKKEEAQGWGWNKLMGVYGTGCDNYRMKEKFRKGDEVTFIVSKSERKIDFLKNGKSVGKLDNLQIPEGDMVIAACLYDEVEFELTEFQGV